MAKDSVTKLQKPGSELAAQLLALKKRRDKVVAKRASEVERNMAYRRTPKGREVHRATDAKQRAPASAAYREQKAQAAASAAEREMALRVLARRRFMPFVMRFKPDYMAGWVHREIAQALEQFSDDVIARKSPRLIITIGPRHGKSELVSVNFPAFHLGRHPSHEIIACSHTASLATSFSRRVRELMRDPGYATVFQTRLSADSQSVEQWTTTAGGGYLAAGVGGPIVGRGANCFPAGTQVYRPAGTADIEHLAPGDEVLSFDLASGRVVAAPVVAVNQRVSDGELVEIETVAGRRVRATPDHRFYVSGLGWVEARNLREGDALVATSAGGTVPGLCQADQATARSRGEEAPEGVCAGVLLSGLLGRKPAEALSYVRRGRRNRWPEPGGEVLLRGVPPLDQDATPPPLPGMPGAVSPKVDPHGVLRKSLRGCCARPADAREGELKLPAREELRGLVPGHAPPGCGAGRWLRGLWAGVRRSLYPPHRPRPTEQPRGEPGNALPQLPLRAPQALGDAVSAVRRLREEPQRVYDVQVAGTHCFFAGGVLVHNCLIIDDPVKNKEEADSRVEREALKEWYSTVAYTRLAPGGGVLLMLQRWHEEDLAGWQIAQMLNDETGHADKWKVLNFPAIATEDEKYRKKGEALHPDRYDLGALLRIKAQMTPRDWEALYQQNPIPEDGEYFKREDFRFYRKHELPESLRRYSAWDLAIGVKETNDYSVGAHVGVDQDDTLWVLDVDRGRWDSFALVEKILDGYHRHRSDVTGIEKGQIELAIGPLLEKRARERRLASMYVEPMPPGRRDKFSRARTIQGRMRQGKVRYPDPQDAPWMNDVIRELLSFGGGAAHDDIVDALAWAGLLINEIAPPPKAAKGKKPPSWREKLSSRLRGPAVRSAMTA